MTMCLQLGSRVIPVYSDQPANVRFKLLSAVFIYYYVIKAVAVQINVWFNVKWNNTESKRDLSKIDPTGWLYLLSSCDPSKCSYRRVDQMLTSLRGYFTFSLFLVLSTQMSF